MSVHATRYDLVGRAMVGERRRLEDLYAEHAPGAIRLAYFVTGDAEAARDLAHDAFVKVAGRWTDLRHPDAFGAYLRRTVINLSRNHLRRRRVERRWLRAQPLQEETQRMPDIEARDDLWRRLQRLPARQRAALVLRYCEDLTEEETARALDTTVGAVKSLVSRATGALRQEMPGPGDG